MPAIEQLLNTILMAKAYENNSGKRCPKCQEKEGDLIVLPTRLSITGYLAQNKVLKDGSEAKIELPQLPDFAKKMVSDIPLKHSNYCLQILRQGYLYVLVDFKNGQKKWRIFSSSSEGCLTEYSDNNTIPNIPPTYNCNIATDGADASYISFKNSKDIFKIYFVFSPNKISNARLELYQDTPEFELSGMTPDQIRNGQTSLKTQDILTNILEISTAIDIAKQEAFLNSKPVFEFRTGERDAANRQLQVIQDIYTTRTTYYDKDILRTYMRYISLYNKLRKRQGVAIVVNDAIGITQSLNNRYHQALEKEMKPWMESKDSEGISNEHRLIILRQLLGFKESFRERRIKEMINKQDQYYDYVITFGDDAGLSDEMKEALNRGIEKDRKQYVENIDNVYTPKLSEDEFKEKYWNRLSQDKLKKFEEEFNKHSQFAEQLAAKRIDDYLKWLKSQQLISALYLYDDTIPLDGIMFQLQMGVCLCGANSSSKVRKVLDEWWLEPQITPTNLSMRTYLFNNKTLIADINEYLDIQQNIAINESDNKGHLPDVDTAINLLNKLTEHVNQTGPLIEQLAQRGFPIALLSVTFADLVRSFLSVTTQKFNQNIKNRLGNLIFAHIRNKALEMYDSGYNINGHSFKATPKRGASQITRVARENFNNADLVNTKIAMMIFAFSSYETLKKLINGEWKNARELAELTASLMATTAAGAQILTSAIKCCIENNPTSKTATVTYTAFGRLFLWSASLSLIAGGISAVLDFVDAKKANIRKNKVIAFAYYARATATLALSISQFVVTLGAIVPWLDNIIKTSIERTIWVKVAEIGLVIGRFAIGRAMAAALAAISFYFSMIIIVVSIYLIIVDINAMQKWFDRCCFSGKLERKPFDDLGEELTEWYQAIQETF